MVGAFVGYFVLRDLGVERLPAARSPCRSCSTSSSRSPPASLGAGAARGRHGARRVPPGAQGRAHRRAAHGRRRLALPPERRRAGLGRVAARVSRPEASGIEVADLEGDAPGEPLGRADSRHIDGEEVAEARRGRRRARIAAAARARSTPRCHERSTARSRCAKHARRLRAPRAGVLDAHAVVPRQAHAHGQGHARRLARTPTPRGSWASPSTASSSATFFLGAFVAGRRRRRVLRDVRQGGARCIGLPARASRRSSPP